MALLLRKGGCITQPSHTAKPIKYLGHIVPEYFTATFYLLDNDGIDPKGDASRFPTWTVELLLRVTKSETVDIVKMEVLGSKNYKGHDYFTTKQFDPDEYATIQARHFNELSLNRVRFISVAVQAVIQSHNYKKTKSGGHSWTLGENKEVSHKELLRVDKYTVEKSYTKLDGTFYETFAKRYRQLVNEGDTTPIKTLKNLYYKDKSVKQVQAYATTCRKKKLLPPAPDGKNSPVRKTTKRKER